MTSFIILASNQKKRKGYANEFCQKLHISDIDITIIDKTLSSKIQSIGIEDIKNIRKKISLKPLKSKMKAVVLEDAHLLTVEAQNALLKVLEEPPAQTIIMLGTDSKEALLPTIISRCGIIELEDKPDTLSEKEQQEFGEFINNLPAMTVGERLKKAEILAGDKEKAIAWLEKLLLFLREKLLEFHLGGETDTTPRKNEMSYLHLIKSFQQLHSTLKTTNINSRFALENTLLTLLS